MHVFVTGASGHIGAAVVAELLARGHQVTGLCRSDAAAAKLQAARATVVRGTLDDLELLGASARAADGVIHLAFKHELSLSGSPDGFLVAAADDLRAVQALGAALEGSSKPLVVTSGTALLAYAGLGRTGTEADALESGPRIDTENATVSLAQRGVRASVVRLPPTVHSSLDHHGFLSMLIAAARARGGAIYVCDGENRWPAVHTLDAAHLYCLALERAAAGTRLHAVADEGVPFRAIAEAIARGLGLQALSISRDEAAALGFVGRFVQVDNPASSARTRELLDWFPTRAGLLADLSERHYFEPRAERPATA
jgi:nucleoside-diphosphate-sugar epimerase